MVMVAGEDGDHGEPEEAVLQSAQGQEPDFGPRRRRPARRSGRNRSRSGSASASRTSLYMNPRLGGDASLNAPLRDGGEGEWQDWLVDDSVRSGFLQLADREELDVRMDALRSALSVLNPRERRIFRGPPARRRADHVRGSRRRNSAFRASASGRSKCARSLLRRCRRR